MCTMYVACAYYADEVLSASCFFPFWFCPNFIFISCKRPSSTTTTTTNNTVTTIIGITVIWGWGRLGGRGRSIAVSQDHDVWLRGEQPHGRERGGVQVGGACGSGQYHCGESRIRVVGVNCYCTVDEHAGNVKKLFVVVVVGGVRVGG